MRIRQVKNGNRPQAGCSTGQCSTRRPRTGKYDSLGICPKCANKRGNKILEKSRKGQTLTLRVRCDKCGTKFELFRVIGNKMNIKSC